MALQLYIYIMIMKRLVQTLTLFQCRIEKDFFFSHDCW